MPRFRSELGVYDGRNAMKGCRLGRMREQWIVEEYRKG